MGKNKKSFNDYSGLVFSTDPNYKPPEPDFEEEEIPKSQQRIRIFLDRRKRKGKAVTVIAGLEIKDAEIAEYCRNLKRQCGVGGSVKDGEIIIQGDQRQKAQEVFLQAGFSNTKLAGG